MDMQLNQDVLNAQRTSRAWSQTHLAEVSGLSLRTIQRIEKSGSASLESVKALASVYEVDIDTLKQAEDSKPSLSSSAIKMSQKAKIISLIVAIPFVVIGLYLFWSGHEIMAWVNMLRDSIFSDTISEQRLDKISFLIVVLTLGLPALISGFIYDFVNGQGLFIKPKT